MWALLKVFYEQEAILLCTQHGRTKTNGKGSWEQSEGAWKPSHGLEKADWAWSHEPQKLLSSSLWLPVYKILGPAV